MYLGYLFGIDINPSKAAQLVHFYILLGGACQDMKRSHPQTVLLLTCPKVDFPFEILNNTLISGMVGLVVANVSHQTCASVHMILHNGFDEEMLP